MTRVLLALDAPHRNSVRVALLATSVLIGRAFAQSCSELVHLSRRLVIGTRANGPRNPAWTITGRKPPVARLRASFARSPVRVTSLAAISGLHRPVVIQAVHTHPPVEPATWPSCGC